ncbi:MAG TPA: signal peptidase II [Puia sp.]|nr:signal peptidase II [Puia sp.]
MISPRILKILTILLLVTANIGCDQVSKSIIRQTVGFNDNIQLLNHHITVSNVENPGAFLSMGDGLPASVRGIALAFLPLLGLIIVLIYLLTRRRISSGVLTGLCFIVGGGIGNIFDRIAHGSVTDFLHIQFGIFQTGIFNMADVSITVGAGILLVHNLFGKSPASVPLT